MTHYTFRIRQGPHSSDVPVELPDDGAGWHEAAMACSDMIRDTVARLGDSPEWRLEVTDQSGTIRHLFRTDRRELQIAGLSKTLFSFRVPGSNRRAAVFPIASSMLFLRQASKAASLGEAFFWGLLASHRAVKYTSEHTRH
jgi:hypothetical protein